MKYLIAFASDSHHLMNESDFYIKTYLIDIENINNFNIFIDKYQRLFSLEFKVPLSEVHYLWAYKIKN